MKCLYRELDRRKKYLFTKLQNEIATLEWQWFQREISDKEYCVQFDDIQRRIREMQGCLIQIKEKEIKLKGKQQNF